MTAVPTGVARVCGVSWCGRLACPRRQSASVAGAVAVPCRAVETPGKWLRRYRGLFTETLCQVGKLALQILNGAGVGLQTLPDRLGSLAVERDHDQAVSVVQGEIPAGVIMACMEIQDEVVHERVPG